MSDALGINQYLIPTLEGFRNKLLDLTTRNNLLNLSLSSKRTSRLLRFIDCDPQVILAELCDGATIQILALPDPPKDNANDEESDEFKQALEVARSQDPLYEQILADSTGDQGLSLALQQAEDRLRSMVREELGVVSKGNKSTRNLVQLAETHGIDPSYELTFSGNLKSGSKSEMHVLHVEASLDRLAEGIRKQARSSIEETGNNILYLAFGCLEWIEKDRKFLAPLVLLPVELTKGATRGGAKTFFLRAADDAPIGNVTLKERLRRDFLIDLPMPAVDTAGVNLMSYYAQLNDAVSERKDWKVNNFLNLALFNFSGLGLYEDLDPEVIRRSVLVRQLLAAELSDEEQPSETDVVAEDQNVDDPAIAERVPVLITQADASQFAGIADVMSGRSMVIEGPPGTGKSQTITNIIANALCIGQRVLFVAEKKVALDVVYTRLADAGLKPYCLRIASDKTNKREVYDELAQRLELPVPVRPKRDAAIEDFQQLRSKLNDFSDSLNSGHGPDDQSPQKLFWRELLLRKQLQGAKVPLGTLRLTLNEATQYSEQQVERITQVIEQLARLCIRPDFESFSSTFIPIGVKPSDALGRDQLIDQADKWNRSLSALRQEASSGETLPAMTLGELRTAAQAGAVLAARLPEPLSTDQAALLPVLASRQGAGVAQDLLVALKAEQASSSKLSVLFNRIPDPLPEGQMFTTFIGRWTQWCLGTLRMPATALQRDQLYTRLSAVSERLERIQVIATTRSNGIAIQNLNPVELVGLNALIDHLSSQPNWILDQRRSPLWLGNRKYTRDLINTYLQLQAEHDNLGLNRGEPPLASTPADLHKAAEGLRQCCEGGMQSVLGQDDAIQGWGAQLESAESLLLSVDSALVSEPLPMDLRGLKLEQLQCLQDLLERLNELSPDALRYRQTDLWSTPPDVITAVLEKQRELEQKKQTLSLEGLRVLDTPQADELRAAATKMEKMSPLRKLVSRSYARASKLAAELGAVDSVSKPDALRLVADVLDLEAVFPTALVQGWCDGGLNLTQATAVVKELDALKRYVLGNSKTASFLEQLRSLPVEELKSLITLFKNSLSSDLEDLVSLPLWSGLAIASRTTSDLRRELMANKANLDLLKKANPYAVWARGAGIEQPERMAPWLEDVIAYRQRVFQFPKEDFEAVLGLLSTDPRKALVVLDASDRNEQLTDAGNLKDLGVVLENMDKTELEQQAMVLREQLLPAVEELFAEQDLLPADGKQMSLRTLLESLAKGIEDFGQLSNCYSDFGLQRELGSGELQSAPIELEIYRRRKDGMQGALAEFRQQAGPDLADTEPEDLRGVLIWINNLKDLALPWEMEEQCLSARSITYLIEQRTKGGHLIELLNAEGETSFKFLNTADFNPTLLASGPAPSVEGLNNLHLGQWLQQLVTMRESFHDWVRIYQLRQDLPSHSEQELADQLMVSGLAAELWETVYRWNLVRSQLNRISDDVPAVRGLQAAEQVARRERFNRVEDQIRDLDRAEVIARIHRTPQQLPGGNSTGPKGFFTEMGLINNEAYKQKRHRPLRHLFQDAGNALRGLKPCWMMSPSTLASLVPREVIEQFDLVIVDEASQMAPERAFGVISRAKQCVVVGDPKQLPPTAFFQRSTSSEDSEEIDEVDKDALDEESILDLCTKSFHPVRRLKWHYRSRHGSLIAFSNKHFYNNELVVFPSCDRDFAIQRHLVEAPRYAKGVNLPEVKQVCEVVLQQLEEHPNRSLGVVAMNEAQSEEIAEQLEMLSIHHEELRRRLDLTDSSDELFVKSLEKVQGDERDTIVISTTYGPSQPGGAVAMRFGPINQGGGHRRLNVLFTRAKYAIALVTSMESHQIQPTATSSQGVHALKGYLKYVEAQSLETGHQSGREPDSEFEIVVAEALTRHGYEVDCQVGVANYFIDLAIRHPDKPETYLLGVECDGATYHSARSARDRDKYRQSVLEGLGWKIYRIWSTDWFENSEAETRKLVAHIETLLGRVT